MRRNLSDLQLAHLSGLSHFGPAVLRSVLPAVGLMEWRTAADVPRLSSVYGFMSPKPAEGAVEERREEVQTLNY